MKGFLFTLIAFLTMEGVAWFTHKYVMHGLLWSLHKDHHIKNHDSFWERNDFFFLIFALPGIVLIWKGLLLEESLLGYLGLGITLYGFTYFFIHDIFIHRRFNIFKKSKNTYLLALRKAHKIHHKHITAENGECFGMLLFPIKFYKAAKRQSKKWPTY